MYDAAISFDSQTKLTHTALVQRFMKSTKIARFTIKMVSHYFETRGLVQTAGTQFVNKTNLQVVYKLNQVRPLQGQRFMKRGGFMRFTVKISPRNFATNIYELSHFSIEIDSCYFETTVYETWPIHAQFAIKINPDDGLRNKVYEQNRSWAILAHLAIEMDTCHFKTKVSRWQVHDWNENEMLMRSQ